MNLERATFLREIQAQQDSRCQCRTVVRNRIVFGAKKDIYNEKRAYRLDYASISLGGILENFDTEFPPDYAPNL